MVRFQPGCEQLLELVWQTQQHIARRTCTGGMCSREDGFHLAISQHRNDRRDQHAHGHARGTQVANHVQPPVWGGGSRFHEPRQLTIERSDRYRHGRQVQARGFLKKIKIALDQR